MYTTQFQFLHIHICFRVFLSGDGTDRVPATVQLGELKRLSRSMRKLARELRDTDKYEVHTHIHTFVSATDCLR